MYILLNINTSFQKGALTLFNNTMVKLQFQYLTKGKYLWTQGHPKMMNSLLQLRNIYPTGVKIVKAIKLSKSDLTNLYQEI